jgi:hypothetical protein
LFRHWTFRPSTKTVGYESEQVPDPVKVDIDVKMCAKVALETVDLKADDGVGMPAFEDLYSQCLAGARKHGRDLRLQPRWSAIVKGQQLDKEAV